METTTVEDSEDQENLKALKNFQIGMTQEGYPYGICLTMEAVNNRDQGVSEGDRNMEHQNSKFCQESPKAGDINYGMIAHGNDKSRNTDIHDVIARLCYCHRAELSMHFFGRIGWQKADGAPISKR